MSLALPAPRHERREAEVVQETRRASPASAVPPYLHRGNFVPTKPEDFGDGGAFPEVHVVQYPLGMGRPGAKSGAMVAVDVDEAGNVRFDAIVRQGSNRGRKVQSSLEDLRETDMDEAITALPDEDEEAAATSKTRAALEALLNGKIRASKPTSAVAVREAEEPTYIRYTPNAGASGSTGAAQSRVIRMVEAQVDPMEPAKHLLKKVPRGPPSPPVPVLHSPPRKITVEDQQAWKVPPCVSNWKNARGYTIPLDKRLAADGRGLLETTINNKFASLTEALYVAERKASEDLRVRDQIRKKMSVREKEDRERELRDMASRARMERAGVLQGLPEERVLEERVQDDGSEEGSRSPTSEAGESEAERVARLQRERLRIERRKERERELRLENMKGALRKNKVDRDQDRDVSEKIALGMHRGSGKLAGEAMYDSRLFNQSAGMDSGFGADDEYSTYSKPMVERGEASVYRPKRDDADVYGDADAQMSKLADTSRFKADKGFVGTEAPQRGGRDAPVQFEKADPFGVTELVGQSKKRARHDDDSD